MKRGEISMEVIIIAAIALLVLVILSVLVLRQTGQVGKDCQNVGGECLSDCSGTSTDGRSLISSGNTCPGEQKCCIPFGSAEE